MKIVGFCIPMATLIAMIILAAYMAHYKIPFAVQIIPLSLTQIMSFLGSELREFVNEKIFKKGDQLQEQLDITKNTYKDIELAILKLVTNKKSEIQSVENEKEELNTIVEEKGYTDVYSDELVQGFSLEQFQYQTPKSKNLALKKKTGGEQGEI